MPELPEVETIKSQITTLLPLKIESLEFSRNAFPRILRNISIEKSQIVQKEIIGREIQKIERWGKWLIFSLDNHHFLISHLGMSGSWQLLQSSTQHKHAHIIIRGPDQKCLSYVDPRRFGHFYYFDFNEKNNFFKRFPIDISHHEFDLNHLTRLIFSGAKKIIKPYLLDQAAFMGIGNYMASEICARAEILPTRLAGSLSQNEIEKLYRALKIVLEGALKTSGTTFGGGYVDAYGEAGSGVDHLVVFYQEYCQMCAEKSLKTKVIKTQLAGRGTYHCPICQK